MQYLTVRAFPDLEPYIDQAAFDRRHPNANESKQTGKQQPLDIVNVVAHKQTATRLWPCAKRERRPACGIMATARMLTHGFILEIPQRNIVHMCFCCI